MSGLAQGYWLVNKRSKGSGSSPLKVVWVCKRVGGCCCDGRGEWNSSTSPVSVEGLRTWSLLLLWDRLLRVSAASMSSIDMPERTLPALVERSSDLIMSMSTEAGLWESA